MIDALTVLLSIPVVLLSVVCVYLYLDRNRLKNIEEQALQTRVINAQFNEQLREMLVSTRILEEELGQEREKNRTLLSQKKSSETRLGQISEHLVPFLENCRHDPKSMHFLGNPVDYVVFDFDGGAITFVEVKSGNSKPSKRQKVIKNIIKTGRIFYDEIRINERGVKNKTVGGDVLEAPKKSYRHKINSVVQQNTEKK
jgi:predicted Holliday junction resolvase-like endonuclease